MMRRKISLAEKAVAVSRGGGRLYAFPIPVVIGLVVLVVVIGVMRGISKKPPRSTRFRPKWSERERDSNR